MNIVGITRGKHLTLVLRIVALMLVAFAMPVDAAPGKSDWGQILAAAKKEGRVVVSGSSGRPARDASLTFKDQYPDIKVEYTGALAREWAPKVRAEQRAGQYLWDVQIGGGPTAYALRAHGVYAPIRPAIILPEVLDDSKWAGGFESGFMDKDKQYVYGFLGFANSLVLVNRNIIPKSKLNALDQLLDPQWKGKISWDDPRRGGAGSSGGAAWLQSKGEDWVRQLLKHDIAISTSGRQQIEWLVRGRYPIAIGTQLRVEKEFRSQGFDKELTWLNPQDSKTMKVTPGPGNVMLVNRAPHPNAAIVYLNWLLSRAGQEAWVKFTGQNSRRLDVPGPPETKPDPAVKYVNPSKEDARKYVVRMWKLAKEILR